MSFIDSCAKMTQLRKLTASAPLPLSAVLIGVVLVPFFITIAVIGWYSIQVLEERTHQRMQKDIELIARAIQLPLSHALANNQQGTIKRALESAFAINRVYGIYVYDRQGNPIYVGGKRVAMDKKRAQGLAQTKDQQSEFVRAGSEKLFSFYIPLVDPGQRIIGLLQLTRRGSDFDAYLATVRNQSLVVIVITTLALSLIILFGHRWVVGRHLARIKHSLSKIKTQDATHRLTPRATTARDEPVRKITS